MATQKLKRTIKFDGRSLADINGMSGEQLRTHYARIYPELSTATVQEDVSAAGVTITFTTGFKAKG